MIIKNFKLLLGMGTVFLTGFVFFLLIYKIMTFASQIGGTKFEGYLPFISVLPWLLMGVYAIIVFVTVYYTVLKKKRDHPERIHLR